MDTNGKFQKPLSLTFRDVKRRARQSTCHGTPGSFKLIADAVPTL